MGKQILFAGKELPFGSDMASGASFQGRRVLATSSLIPEDELEEAGQQSLKNGAIVGVAWNRSSPLSCRSLALKCENEGGMDEIVLIFDEFYFATQYRDLNTARVLEELIGSYQYLTNELLTRLKRQANRKFKLVFLYKPNYSQCDGVNSSQIRTSGIELSTPLLAAAGGAFKNFAENTAALLADGGNITPLLVLCEPQNDLSKRDSSLSVWLCEYMDSIDNLKKPLSPKQKVAWVKAGAKNPGGFGILGF